MISPSNMKRPECFYQYSQGLHGALAPASIPSLAARGRLSDLLALDEAMINRERKSFLITERDQQLMKIAREPGEPDWPSVKCVEHLNNGEIPKRAYYPDPYGEKRHDPEFPVIATCERCQCKFEAAYLNDRAPEIKPKHYNTAIYSRSIRVTPGSLDITTFPATGRIPAISCPRPDLCQARTTRWYTEDVLFDWPFRRGERRHLPNYEDIAATYTDFGAGFPTTFIDPEVAEKIRSIKNIAEIYASYLAWRYLWIQTAIRGKTLPKYFPRFHMWGHIDADIQLMSKGLITPVCIEMVYGMHPFVVYKLFMFNDSIINRKIENIAGIINHVEPAERTHLQGKLNLVVEFLRHYDLVTVEEGEEDRPAYVKWPCLMYKLNKNDEWNMKNTVPRLLRGLNVTSLGDRPHASRGKVGLSNPSGEDLTFPQLHLERLSAWSPSQPRLPIDQVIMPMDFVPLSPEMFDAWFGPIEPHELEIFSDPLLVPPQEYQGVEDEAADAPMDDPQEGHGVEDEADDAPIDDYQEDHGVEVEEQVEVSESDNDEGDDEDEEIFDVNEGRESSNDHGYYDNGDYNAADNAEYSDDDDDDEQSTIRGPSQEDQHWVASCQQSLAARINQRRHELDLVSRQLNHLRQVEHMAYSQLVPAIEYDQSTIYWLPPVPRPVSLHGYVNDAGQRVSQDVDGVVWEVHFWGMMHVDSATGIVCCQAFI
ncbi:hypothetical protein F5X68DRAFT_190656 [Plectosphaerella plurivora]|uniref:Uncharacterized protein n=1 Tax=Plectosphaerella plurivora TaxID=936078 RepID=A0A9P9ABT3_9PEZI|nr:hypothetical protein F5X68DRAFT_190656 [Plectosphaerella plurivora]